MTKIDTTLFYWSDTPGVLMRRDEQQPDYMCTGVMLAAQVLQGGQAILVAADDADATIEELRARGMAVHLQPFGATVEVAA